jgi:hypothetical protein
MVIDEKSTLDFVQDPNVTLDFTLDPSKTLRFAQVATRTVPNLNDIESSFDKMFGSL